MFIYNDEMMEIRQLREVNATLRTKIRACEKLLSSGSSERVQFLEGALWICKKFRQAGDQHRKRVVSLLKEVEQRGQSVPESPEDVKLLMQSTEWSCEEIKTQLNELLRNFDGVNESVMGQLGQIRR